MKRYLRLKNVLAVILAVLMIFVSVPSIPGVPGAGVYAASRGLTVTGGTEGVDYTYEGGKLTVISGTPLTIGNVKPDIPTQDTIVINAPGINADVTLNNVNIDLSGNSGIVAFEVVEASSLTLTLAPDSVNTMITGDNYGVAAMVNNQYPLTIKGSGTLNLRSQGSMTGALGIKKWNDSKSLANVTITDHAVVNLEGKKGPALGGSKGADNIVISGYARVTAKSTHDSSDSYGIGSVGGAGLTITDSAIVWAESGSSRYGEGMGGNGICGGPVYIGGNCEVTAIGSWSGIGDGFSSNCTLVMTGGHLTAKTSGETRVAVKTSTPLSDTDSYFWRTTEGGAWTANVNGDNPYNITECAVKYLEIIYGSGYKLSYDKGNADAGFVPAGVRAYAEGEVPTALGNYGNFTKENCEFDHWNTKIDGSGTSYWPLTSITLTGDTVLYPQFVPRKYNVYFNANGGEGEMSNQELTCGTAATLSECSLTKSGYKFKCWNTKADGTGMNYYDKESVLNMVGADEDEITLYAQWKDENDTSCTLHFETNGGSVIEDSVRKPGVSVDLTIYEPLKAGYTFEGWYSDKQLTNRITSIGMDSDKDVYAKYSVRTMVTIQMVNNSMRIVDSEERYIRGLSQYEGVMVFEGDRLFSKGDDHHMYTFKIDLDNDGNCDVTVGPSNSYYIEEQSAGKMIKYYYEFTSESGSYSYYDVFFTLFDKDTPQIIEISAEKFEYLRYITSSDADLYGADDWNNLRLIKGNLILETLEWYERGLDSEQPKTITIEKNAKLSNINGDVEYDEIQLYGTIAGGTFDNEVITHNGAKIEGGNFNVPLEVPTGASVSIADGVSLAGIVNYGTVRISDATVSGDFINNGTIVIPDGKAKETYETNYGGEILFEKEQVIVEAFEASNIEDTSVNAGNGITFNAPDIEGAEYQWQIKRPGDSEFANIENATGAALTVDKLETADSGVEYRCVITKDGTTTVASQPAKITVTVRRSGGGAAEKPPIEEAKTSVISIPEEMKNNAVSVSNFGDLGRGMWYYESVRFVCENGLMRGVSAGSFGANDATTRGMLLTILYRLESEPAVTGNGSLKDVKKGAWNENASLWALEAGMSNGYGNGRVGADDVITREQLATILYRYAGMKGIDVKDSADISAYADGNSVSSYAEDAMKWACANGIITGTNRGLINPSGATTRAEMATMLQRFIENFQ